MAVKMKSLKEMGVPIPEVQTVSNEEMSSLSEKDLKADVDIKYEEWRRVEVDGTKSKRE